MQRCEERIDKNVPFTDPRRHQELKKYALYAKNEVGI